MNKNQRHILKRLLSERIVKRTLPTPDGLRTYQVTHWETSGESVGKNLVAFLSDGFIEKSVEGTDEVWTPSDKARREADKGTSKDMDGIYALKQLDCNCTDCIHMERDFDRQRSFDHLYTNSEGVVCHPSHRILYGTCGKFGKAVSFIPNTIQLATQDCFELRRKAELDLQID